MATRSTIALEFADGTVHQVYCHWDGYLDNNGVILKEHYSDPFKVKELVALGGFSSLNETVEATAETAYTQRGEELSIAKFKDFQEYTREAQFEEYDYILRNVNGKAQWFVQFYGTDGEYLTIEEAFEFQKEKEAEYE